MNPTLIIGGPGTGKTYSLVQEILERKPERFALLSFTKRAANEAKERLGAYYTESQLKYVRTIHSFCFELLGLKTSQVIQWNHIKEFGNEYGYEFTGRIRSLEDATNWNLTEDDIEFRQMQIKSAKMIEDFDTEMFKRYELFKYTNKLLDYNDMIIKCIDNLNYKIGFDLLCVDEFQDLSPLQLGFIASLKDICSNVVFAGDDNQMIFEWAGVDRQLFKKISLDCDTRILRKNYRITGDIENLSKRIASRQQDMINRSINNASIENNNIERIPEIVPFDVPIINESTLILTRNAYLMRQVIDQLEDYGYTWSWLGDHYKKTQIKLSTIHASKGSEADNVVLLTDVSPATYEHIDEDSEHRVWYVGITRARKKLYTVYPQTDYFYDLL